MKTMIDDEQDDEEAQEIPLPNVKSAILAKVIEFAQHYRTEPMNEIEKVFHNFIAFFVFIERMFSLCLDLVFHKFFYSL